MEGPDLELLKRFMRYVYDKAEYSCRRIWHPEYGGMLVFVLPASVSEMALWLAAEVET